MGFWWSREPCLEDLLDADLAFTRVGQAQSFQKQTAFEKAVHTDALLCCDVLFWMGSAGLAAGCLLLGVNADAAGECNPVSEGWMSVLFSRL